ncbi:MAG: CBS domain-containing protein [Planctomycetes bacterium]|nr:CBS domain-containing protein [Planctomycetota bacterium]
MECPSCGHDNLPGADHCAECQTSLTQEDVPVALIRSRIEHSLSEDTIETLHPAAAVSVGEDTPLDEAVGIMRDKKIGCLLVTDSRGKLSGILTERDLLNKVAGRVDDLASHTVREFMALRPETVRADQLLAYALQRMKVGDLRHLPLIDDQGRPKEIISSRDIINYLASLVEGIV